MDYQILKKGWSNLLKGDLQWNSYTNFPMSPIRVKGIKIKIKVDNFLLIRNSAFFNRKRYYYLQKDMVYHRLVYYRLIRNHTFSLNFFHTFRDLHHKTSIKWSCWIIQLIETVSIKPSVNWYLDIYFQQVNDIWSVCGILEIINE